MSDVDSVTLHVKDRADMLTKLDSAVDQLIELGLQLRCGRGILVTRYSPRDFTVELHPSVPFGTTHERLAELTRDNKEKTIHVPGTDHA